MNAFGYTPSAEELVKTAAENIKYKNYAWAEWHLSRAHTLSDGQSMSVSKSMSEEWKGRADFLLGYTYLKLGKYDQALQSFEEVVKNYPVLADWALFYKGQIYLEQNNDSIAVAEFNRLIETYPYNPIVKEIPDAFRTQLSSPAPLQTLQSSFVSRSKPQSQTLYEYARASSDRNDYRSAIRYYKKAAKYNDAYGGMAAYRLGRWFHYRGDKNTAFSYYQKVMDYPPNSYSDDAAFKLGIKYYLKGYIRRAYETFQKGVNAGKNNDYREECLYWAAKSLEKLGDSSAAYIIYTQIADEYDHTYYSYRTKAKLEITEWPPVNNTIEGKSLRKIRELLLLGLNPQAEFEAENAASAERDLCLGLICSIQNKFKQAIRHVDGKINAALWSGKTNAIPDEIWKAYYPLGYSKHIYAAAGKFDVDPLFMAAMIRQESVFDPGDTSWANAKGLMQIIPSTGWKIAKKLGMGDYRTRKLYEIPTNVRMGAYYIGEQIKNHGGNLYQALAAYNAGSHRVARWKKAFPTDDIDEFVESIEFLETRNYVKIVMNNYWEYQRIYRN
jgi:tetratricopeptide (TPR) repeat protein